MTCCTLNADNVLHSPGLENHLEIRVRKGAGSFDGDKHKDDIGDVENRQLSSKNDTAKDGRRKSEKYKDERNREKYREDVDRDGKERDEQLVRDHISRSNDRDLRDEKDAMDMHHKRNKPQDSDLDREVTKAKREGDLDAMRDQDHDRHHGYERDHDQESRRRRGRDRDRDHDRDGRRNRSRSHARDRYSDYECDVDRDGSHLEDQYTKYVDSRGRKRSPNDHNDSVDARSKSLKNSHHANDEKKSLSNDKVDSDAERGRSQSRSRHGDANLSSHRRKSSPSSLSRVGTDEYRHQDLEDLRDRYPKKEERSISTRDKGVLSGVQEKGSKYSYSEKPSETEGGNATELLRDRSLNSKNVDIEESGRRQNTSIDAKDLSSNKDRHGWDIQGEKPVMDDSSQAESYYSKGSQNNPSPFHPRPAFRGGVDIPFDGSLDDDGRLNSNSRFRRGSDPNLGRVHGNTWRGVPNWSAPLPNGFIPFQHGPPPHGSFQSIMPQFPAPPLFGIRPPLEINHSGIHYRMPDAERFSSHMHSLGWQNMLDGSSPSHLHGWDGNNGIFRDESHIYSGAEWDENRQMVNGRGWESKAEMWKRQSGSLKRELPSQFQKDERSVQDPVDDVSSREVCDESADNTILTKTAEIRPNIPSAKESPNTPELFSETPTPLRRSMDDNSKLSCSYLSKLKISTELVHPDLYHQCQRLMDNEHSATADEETAAYIVLEGGMRAVSISSNSAHQSLFHPDKNSVFQHAMDLYKKQRMEMKEMQVVSGGMASSDRRLEEKKGLQVVPGGMASSERKLEEKAFNFNNEEVKASDSTVDAEMAQAPIKTTGVDKDVEATEATGKLEDMASTASQEEVKCLENSEESLPITNVTEVDMIDSEQQVNLDAEKDTIIKANDDIPVNDTDKFSNKDKDGKGIVNSKNSKDSAPCGVGNSCFDTAVSGPLSFPDEIPETCEGLMPVSIGSESLILSQIHHSPESTH